MAFVKNRRRRQELFSGKTLISGRKAPMKGSTALDNSNNNFFIGSNAVKRAVRWFIMVYHGFFDVFPATVICRDCDPVQSKPTMTDES